MNTQQRYDGGCFRSRENLADELLALFARAEFTEVFIKGTKERLFAREVPGTEGKIRVVVYSTIEGHEVRRIAKDAIRVCALYKGRDGQERGIASGEKRVNRTGTIEAICDRVISRMRDCWKATKPHNHERCPKCGAPMFKSKVRKDKRTGQTRGGNLVCADLCWKSDAQLRDDSYRRQPSYTGSYGRRGRYNPNVDYPASPTFSRW
jgi:hypothetical protein